MSAAAKLTSFAALLLLAFAGSAVAGRVVSPERPAGLAEADHAEENSDSMGMSSGEHGASAHEVRGLAIADHGVQLEIQKQELRRGVAQQISYRIVDGAGNAVKNFEPTHTKPMHLIIVRRDLTGFQHLHPTMSEDGTWSTQTVLPEAGSYRLFADFLRDGEPVTLAGDLRVDGASDLKPLPPQASVSTTDGGYEVRIATGSVSAGKPAALRFAVTDHGQPIAVQQYLGAAGHLVALRDGDLAFLHVHPEEHGSDGEGSDPARGKIAFEATFPTAGSYRLFLQFKHNGRVETVAFTQEVK